MEFTLQAKSSSGDYYNVIILVKEDRVLASCNCKAGIFGQLCKHKLSFLSGDKSLLFDMEQLGQFNHLQELLSNKNIKKLASQLICIKSEIEEKKKEENKIKKLIEKELK